LSSKVILDRTPFLVQWTTTDCSCFGRDARLAFDRFLEVRSANKDCAVGSRQKELQIACSSGGRLSAGFSCAAQSRERRMQMKRCAILTWALMLVATAAQAVAAADAWIRVNQVGYLPNDPKIAVLSSDAPLTGNFRVGELTADGTVRS
jgi:hypothetical protein